MSLSHGSAVTDKLVSIAANFALDALFRKQVTNHFYGIRQSGVLTQVKTARFCDIFSPAFQARSAVYPFVFIVPDSKTNQFQDDWEMIVDSRSGISACDRPMARGRFSNGNPRLGEKARQVRIDAGLFDAHQCRILSVWYLFNLRICDSGSAKFRGAVCVAIGGRDSAKPMPGKTAISREFGDHGAA